MNIIELMVTDLRSCEAVVKIMQAQEPELKSIIIKHDVWHKIANEVSSLPNPHAYVSHQNFGLSRALYVSGVRVHYATP